MNPIVDITALRKSYGTNEVLKGIDLKVRPARSSPSSARAARARARCLRCINGLEEFQDGALSVDGQKLLHDNATAMRALRQRVGMIFQSFNLFPHLTVGRNIMLAPSLVKKTDAAKADAQARKLLQRV
jgi:polar amino acid transport system ATP-binding protein